MADGIARIVACTMAPATSRAASDATRPAHRLTGVTMSAADPTPKTFGALLEKLMLRAGIWDTALARRLGASRSEVFRWRTGRAMPTRRNLERLQNALQWSADGVLVPLDPAEWDQLLVLGCH